MSTVRYSVEFVTDVSPSPGSGQKRETLQRLRNIINAIQAGATHNGSTVTFRTGTVRASGTLTISGGSGTIGGSINGVAFTTSSTSADTTDAATIAAAINASSNALILNLVTASAASGVITITAVEGGKSGNQITLAASGTGVTASGARLTGGTETYTSFTF